MKHLLTTVFLMTLASLSSSANAETLKQCPDNSVTGNEYRITGDDINVREGPGTAYKKVINAKASRILKKTQYVTLSNTVTVHEECRTKDWSRIYVTKPDYLKTSHHGWISSKFLRDQKYDKEGNELFTEQDIYFTKKTGMYKELIVKGVNKAYREHEQCKTEMDLGGVFMSTKSTYANPIFFVTCGSGRDTFNVFFSKSDFT